jgi:hypothetical protein
VPLEACATVRSGAEVEVSRGDSTLARSRTTAVAFLLGRDVPITPDRFSMWRLDLVAGGTTQEPVIARTLKGWREAESLRPTGRLRVGDSLSVLIRGNRGDLLARGRLVLESGPPTDLLLDYIPGDGK